MLRTFKIRATTTDREPVTFTVRASGPRSAEAFADVRLITREGWNRGDLERGTLHVVAEGR